MSVKGTGFWGYRWESYEHRELYDMVTTGKGAGVVGPAQDAWASFTKLMNESRDRIDQLQRDAGVSWEGQAAGAMHEGVSPLTGWAQESASAGEQTHSSLRQVADGFSHASNAMPEPVAVPSKLAQGLPGNFTGLLAGQVDEDAADQRAQQAHQQAIELMNGYTANNAESADTTGTFSDPPDIGITAARQGELGGRTGGVIDGPAGSDGAERGGSGQSGSGQGAPDQGGPRESGPGQGGPGQSGTGQSGTGGLGTQPGGTDPSRVAPQAGQPGGGPAAGGPASGAPTNPGTPITGVPAGPLSGGPSGGAPGRGGPFGGGPGRAGGEGAGGRGFGEGGGRGSGEGAGGRGAGGRGAIENAAVRGAGQGGRGAGVTPFGAGGARGEEDKERNSPEYLRAYNDEFWDDTPAVAPSVIGMEDD